MSIVFWKGWSMRARLLAIALIPVAYMFCTFVWYAYQSRLSDVRDELAERGPLVAKVLADSREFGLVSSRLDELKLTINGLLQSDASIYRVELLDAARRVVAQVSTRAAGQAQPEPRYYEAPVLKHLMWVTLLAADGKPYVHGASGSGATVETIGYVRVTMSPSAMLLKQMRHFYVELTVASLGLLVCALLAFQLAKGFDASLQASMRALRAADAEKRRLIRKVNTVVEDERKSIALEIHDELNASLIAARLESQRIFDVAGALEEGAPRDEIRSRAQAIIKLTLGLYNSGRALVRRLRPEVLDMLGLHGAVEEMVRHYDNAHAGCRFSFAADGRDADFARLESAIGISAYRMIQEALSNVVKHARATQASVTLLLDADALHIAVADNGRGYDTGQASAGIGIVGMRERVYAFNGGIDIDGSSGTRIAIRLPLTGA